MVESEDTRLVLQNSAVCGRRHLTPESPELQVGTTEAVQAFAKAEESSWAPEVWTA